MNNNTFVEFLNSKYIIKVDCGNNDNPPRVKLSKLTEYYKFWCLFNDKTAIMCHQNVTIKILTERGYKISMRKMNNKQVRCVDGMKLVSK